MADEITEFLKRAAMRRAQLLKQQQMREAPPAEEVVVADVVETRSRSFSKLEQTVAKDLDTSQFAVRADRMGDVPEQADDRMGSHLHEKFDHQLGNIARPTEAVTGEITAETETRMEAKHPLLDLLQNPTRLRSAFILGELLRRPEENW